MGVNGIYGLSGSGLDIESLVKIGMSSKNNQYDKMEQQEIANTWLKEAYTDVYSDLQTYKYSTLSTYKMQSNMNAMSATSTNSNVVTASANGAAAAMNHVVTVDSVASNAYLLTAQNPTTHENYGITRHSESTTNSNKLSDVIFKSYNRVGEEADGTGIYDITLADGTKLQGVSGNDNAISLTLKDTAKSITTYNLSYTYEDLFNGEKTLNDFASAISRTGANIQGGFDIANDSFSMYNKTSGSDNIIGITADNANTAELLNCLNLGSYDASTNVLSDRYTFTADNAMPTTMESKGITSSALSVNFKDILGLSATVDGDTITIKDGDTVLKTLTKNGSTYDGINDTAFSIKLDNGTDDATISFTYAELFNFDDTDNRTSLLGNAGLDELAAKINGAGLGMEAKYDVTKDSFSLVNSTGDAVLSAVSGTGQAVAESLIDALNLTTSDKLSYLTTANSNNLADVFGVHTGFIKVRNVEDTYNLNIRTANGTSLASQTGSNADFTLNPGQAAKKNENLFSFDISDGTNTATVQVKYGDIVDYSAFNYNEGNNVKVYYGSGSNEFVQQSSGAGETTVRDPSNNLSVLAAKINEAAQAAGVNITADYQGGKFSLLNPNGEVTISNVTGASVDVSGSLNLTETDPAGVVAYKTSAGIKRASATSSDDSLTAGLGLTAMKDSEGRLFVRDSNGTTTEVNASDVAVSLLVGDSSQQTAVTFTYADLFDTSGSGTLKGKMDMGAVAQRITDTAAANGVSVTAAYDKASGGFNLSNANGYATLSGSDTLGSSLVAKLGLTESGTTIAAKDHTFAGTNASATIDGKSYDLTTNRVTVAGVTYNFLNKTATDQPVTVSVNQDTDKIVDYVKSFVEDYNKLLDSLNEKLSEQKYSDYKPLSSRQEDEMTEKQIEKWTAKAKSGLLYHNSTIRELVSAMREAVYTRVDAVESEYNSMSAIGITSSNVKGHLTLNEDKLKAALAADPDCVYQLFASDQDSSYIAGSTNKNKITNSQQKLDYANTGVANRLNNVMTNYMSEISDIAGTSKETDDQSYLGKLITNMKTRMSTFKTQMSAYENKLFKRYDAMEVALAKLSAQLGYISGSFS